VRGAFFLDPAIFIAVPKSIAGALQRFDRNSALLGALTGIGFAGLTAWRLRGALSPRVLACFVLMLMALGAGALSYIGRHGEGVGGVANPRYTTMANLFWLGLGSLFFLRPEAFRLRGSLRAATLVLTVLLCMKTANLAVTGGKNRDVALEYREMAETLRQNPPESLPDSFFQKLGTTPSIVRDLFIYTRDNRLSIYRP
jgi:hypothetical protein